MDKEEKLEPLPDRRRYRLFYTVLVLAAVVTSTSCRSVKIAGTTGNRALFSNGNRHLPTINSDQPSYQPPSRFGAPAVASVQASHGQDPVLIFIPLDADSRIPGNLKTYTVAPGDSLSRVAINVYGDYSQWQRIFNANRHILASPDDLKPGMTLTIP